jgi:hypothetical protein
MAGNAIIMDLEKKNVILAKKIVLEAEKVRKLEVKIEDMTVCPLRRFVGSLFRLRKPLARCAVKGVHLRHVYILR